MGFEMLYGWWDHELCSQAHRILKVRCVCVYVSVFVYVYMHACIHVCACSFMHVCGIRLKIKGQLAGAGFFFPPDGALGLHSGCYG